MGQNKKQIVLDTDFIKLITAQNDGQLLKKLMEEHDATPVVHQYVAEHELFETPIALAMIEEGYLHVIKYEDYLQNDLYRKQYENAFLEGYNFCNNHPPYLKKCDIFSLRKSGENIGEIHSALMASFLRLEIFMSNDKGAKHYVETKINTQRYQLKVSNVVEVFEEIAKVDKKSITFDEFKSATKGLLPKANITSIKKMWK